MRVQLLPLRMKEMITVCVFVCVHAQSCPTLCNSMDCSPPGSSIHGILQARILNWIEIKWSESRSIVSDSVRPRGLYSPRNSLGQNIGVGSLLQGIFPAQGSNPGLPHCRRILYQLDTEGGCYFLFQGLFPIQGLNPHHLHLLHWQADSLTAEPQGRPMCLRGNNCFQSQIYVSNYWNKFNSRRCQGQLDFYVLLPAPGTCKLIEQS